jgi:hypothetical protein
MSEYKFKIGQSVFVRGVPDALSSAYVIATRLPERNGKPQYQVRNVSEEVDRVVYERELVLIKS